MIDSLNTILATSIRIRIVDAGVHSVNTERSYSPLLLNGEGKLIGFEFSPEALAALNRKQSKNERYLPYVLGDGREHTLHICSAPGMTSLFKPNMDVLGLLTGFSEWSRVVKEELVRTYRLDDIPEVQGFDLIKLDVQGAELMILENALRSLSDAVLIQVEVEFIPLYERQPLFADVDAFLRKQGFAFHRFETLESRVLRPLILNNDVYAGLSQVFWTDAIYMKDFTKLERFTNDQLLRLALILHNCYHSFDVVLHLLLEHDRRASTDFGSRYQSEGLGAKPRPV